MTWDKARLRQAVRAFVDEKIPEGPSFRGWDDPSYAGRELITEKDVMEAHRQGRTLVVSRDTVVTPLAQDAVQRYRVKIEFADAALLSQTSSACGAGCSRGDAIAIAADHGGFQMKQDLIAFLEGEAGFTCLDLGTNSSQSVDYPDFAAQVAELVATGQCRRGIIIDGAGIGSAMVANKRRGIRAAHCSHVVEARNAREHNDANILTLGAGVIDLLLAQAITLVFLKTNFEGGRHQRRVDKIMEMEQ